ncbi:MAG: hypothetical protein ACI9BW_002968 [Gammaproteobacteria bacterium]|jgi:hypothetical protein
MNWEAISAVGEILGATGVIVSLVYLATQIKTQNQESRLAAMHEISVGFRDATSRITEGDLADIWVRSLKDYDGLEESERLKLIIAITAIIRAWEEAFIQHQTGHLETRIWQTITKYHGFILGSIPVARVWEIRKAYFDDQFREYVDNMEKPEWSMN